MENILRSQPALSHLIECFAAARPLPLLPPHGDIAWKDVAENPLARLWLTAISARATTDLSEPFPELSDELYADYSLTGNRLRFERVYFERRRRLARAVISALTTQDPKQRQQFLASTLSKMQAVFEEPAWALPAHGRRGGKDPMCIDLFAGETANLFGELLNIFHTIVPLMMQHQIQQRLRTQIFENYLRTPPYWTAVTNNWNAVCHQGVLGSALAVLDDPRLLAELFIAAIPRLVIFLGGFAPDGGCSEGPAYWGYGFGWLAELNRQLETRTAGQLSLFEGDPHIRAITHYGPRVTLTNGLSVNFADCVADAVPRPALLDYLSERFDDPVLRSYATLSWTHAISQPPKLDIERADVMLLSRQLLRCPINLIPGAELPIGDNLLADLGVIVSRFRDEQNHLWEFACKAGHNAEHHNHNDLGSYLLNIDGRRLLTETGAPEYVGSFFGPQRYEFIATRSIGHPVPLINNTEQPEGKAFFATLKVRESTAAEATIEIDLTAAYPPAAGCRRCLRTIHLDKGVGQITVTDSFELSKTDALETALITESEVTESGAGAIITNDSLALQLTPGPSTRLTEIQTHPYSDHDGHPAILRRIVLSPVTLAATVELSYTLRL